MNNNWNFESYGGVLFQGIHLPKVFDSYGSANTIERRVNNLSITSISVTAKRHTGTNFVIFGTDPETGVSAPRNSYGSTGFTYDPNSSNRDKRTEFEAANGIHNTTVFPNYYHNWTTVSSEALRYNKYTPPVISKEDGRYIIISNTIVIENTWIPNTLLPVKVVKHWKDDDTGTSVYYTTDQYDVKQDVTFSITGTTPNGGTKGIPIFSSEDAAWSEGQDYYTISKTDANKDSGTWEPTVYVPTYDTSTYDRNHDPVCQAYSYDNDSVTENTLSIGTDEDGFPKGEWKTEFNTDTTTIVVNRQTEAQEVDYEYDDTVTGFLRYTVTDSSSFTGVKYIKIIYPANVLSDGEQIQAEVALKIELAQDITVSDQSGSNQTKKRYELYGFDLPTPLVGTGTRVKRVDFLNSSGALIGTGTLGSNMTDYGVYRHDPNNGDGRKRVTGNYQWIDYGSNTYCFCAPVQGEIELTVTIPPETIQVNEEVPLFNITNTYTPNKAVTLNSVFDDESLDRDSTKDIASVTYIIEGTTAKGAAYSRTVTTSAPDTAGSTDSKIVRTFSKLVYVPKGTYTITETTYTVNGRQWAPVAYAVSNKISNSTQDGNSRASYAVGVDTTVTFTNVRKQLPVKVMMDWEPGLVGSEDPLAASIQAGNPALKYTISYENSRHELMPLTGGSYELTKARQENVYDAIPTYSVFGTYTVCELDDTNMKNALSEYNLNVTPAEKMISGVNTLVFTIEAHIKRAGIVVEKHFDEGFNFSDYKGATLTYTITRSDGQNIYGTNTDSVEMRIEVPDSGDAAEAFTGEILLNGENNGEPIISYYSGLDARTQAIYPQSYTDGNTTVYSTINLPILRTTDVVGTDRVKYVLTESVSGGATSAYFPSFTDQSGNIDDKFEQTNPPGQNVASANFGAANQARFILNPSGIVVGIDNADAPYICKIEETFNGVKTEIPFRYLNAAVKYARENITMDSTHPVTIQMLVDYTIPGSGSAPGTTPAQWKLNDRVVLNQTTDNITITTAATSGGVYNFVPTFTETQGRHSTDSTGTAILQRGWDGGGTETNALFYLNDASARLTTKDIIFDGQSKVGTETETTQKTGRMVYVNDGSLSIEGGTTVRKFQTPGSGGAVYSANGITVSGTGSNRVEFDDCSATSGNGGAIYMNAGTLSLGGSGTGDAVSIRNCTATHNGGAIYNASTRAGSTTAVTVKLNNVIIDGHDQSRPGGALPAGFMNAVNGGAIYLKTGTLDIAGGEIRNCRVHTNGGAIYNNSNATATYQTETETETETGTGTNTYTATVRIAGTTIRGFSGTGGTLPNAENGGAIYNHVGKLRVSDSYIYDCKASAVGGALYEDNRAETTFGTVVMQNVTIDGHTGGLSDEIPNAQLGGAIYTGSNGNLRKGGTIRLTNCQLLDCTVRERGGAIYSLSTMRNVTNSSTNEPTLHLIGTVINGHSSLPDTIQNAERGGGILLANGTLELDTGSVIRNCSASQYGGAIDSYGEGTQFKNVPGFVPWSANDYTVKMNGATIINCTAGEKGGGINIKSILTMLDSRILSCSAGKNGGAINSYGGLDATKTSTTVININDPDHPNIISGNTAGEKGAGIYMLETTKAANKDARLNLAGAQNFGGSGTDSSGNLTEGTISVTVRGETVSVTAGNFVTKDSSFKNGDEEPKNGGKDYLSAVIDYYQVRQDIYIAGYLGTTGDNPTPATSLYVTGAVSNTITNDVGANDGSIWVWAEMPGTDATDVEKENNHYRQLKQFAVFTDDFKNLTDEQKAGTIRVFRNAADDARTENGTDSYLTGMLEGDLTVPSGSTYAGYIYWNGVSGNRKVVLRKVVKDTYASLQDAVFTIWKGSAKVTGTDIDGQTDAQSFTSGSSGVFYAGILDYGTYLIEETEAPSGYQAGWYYFILDGDHALMSDVFTGDNAKEAAKAAADAYNKAINLANQIINGKKTYAEATAGIEAALKAKVDEMLTHVGRGDLISSGS